MPLTPRRGKGARKTQASYALAEKLGRNDSYPGLAHCRRRNLTPSQFAMLAADLQPLYAKAAKERQGTRSDIKAKLPESEKRQARDDAAKVMGVSLRLVQDTKLVLAKGTPEDVAAQPDRPQAHQLGQPTRPGRVGLRQGGKGTAAAGRRERAAWRHQQEGPRRRREGTPAGPQAAKGHCSQLRGEPEERALSVE